MAPPSSLAGAQGTDIVRGKVTGPDKKPITGASVTITAPEAGTVKTTRTNESGLYTALFTENENQYTVTVKAIGFAPRTFHVERVADEAVLVGNIELKTAATSLESVTIEASARPRPRGGDQRSVGGNERDITMNGRFLENPGDLAALAGTVPGVVYTPGQNGEPGTFSVLGVPSDQNRIVVDGTGYDGTTLPQDAIGRARLVTSSFDPSKGQFAGASVVANTRSGRNTREGTARLVLGAPTLTWTDPSSATPEANSQSWSGSIGGPIKKGKLFYFGALQFDRRASGLLSLLNASSTALDRFGISRDTAVYLSNLLADNGVPLSASGAPTNSVNGNGSLLVKFDATPSAASTMSLRIDTRWNNNDGNGISARNFPSAGSRSRSNNSGVQLSVSKYFDKGFLNELRSYVSLGQNSTAGYLSLPGGQVLVTAASSNTGFGFNGGISSLRFGGSSSGRNRSHRMSWETTNETSWLTTDSKHQFKLSQSITLTRDRALSINNPFGTFTYNSLADLASNTPASFTRTLSAQERTSNGVSAGVSVGDTYRLRRGVQIQYGLRADMARPGSNLLYNPVVDSLFGMRTDRVPHDLGLSPRLGFLWTLGLKENDTTSIRIANTNAGTNPNAPTGNTGGGFRGNGGGGGGGGFNGGGFGGAGGGRFGGAGGRGGFSGLVPSIGPQRNATISGGIGAFRGIIPTQRITSAAAASGLSTTTLILSCIGAAVPNPDWDLYLSNPELIPEQCLDGAAPVEFSSRNPNVTVFDKNYRAPVSWRTNLNFSKTFFGWWSTSAVLTYSLNKNESSPVDLNLAETPYFMLGEENGRPVFVPSSAIVSATGAVSSIASRKSSNFNRVLRQQSDMRSSATQFTLVLSPQKRLFNKLPLNLGYTNSSSKSLRRGFETNTSGDPFKSEWGNSMTARHQIVIGTGLQAGWLNIALAGSIASGLPYTPTVSGDINGDGSSSNDRAFIFNPTLTTDAELSAQMQNVLNNASREARDCLKRQLGTIAGAGSCKGGWSVQPNLSIGLNPNKTFNVRNGLQFSVLTVNSAGALARVLGLKNSFLGQSSYQTPPDPVLLYVTGYDPVAKSFKYRVNDNFGDARNRRNGSRYQAPFQILLRGELRLGGPRPPSIIRTIGLRPSGDSALTLSEVQKKLAAVARGPMDSFLFFRDSVQMTNEQVASIEQMKVKFQAEVDSTMSGLAQYVVSKGGKLNDEDFVRKLQPKQSFLHQRALYWLNEIHNTLQPEQWKKLPSYITGGNQAGANGGRSGRGGDVLGGGRSRNN